VKNSPNQIPSVKRLTSIVNNSPFPWRFEITNGYQEGFVYYALLGYANEQDGDIPVAYRCYQNSLACIDEDKSFDHPLPRAEIYLAIGRTCLAAGRYMDAKDWLDNAFLEAGDNLQLQAAIDRVLIRRANEIGDYPEIIFLYQHLEQLAGGQKTEDRGQNAKGKRITELSKSEIANYAQILFYSRKDREGFSKLLEGICNLGIDNNLGVKDPLVDKFLNNIMRADDDEVKYFYDLLGWAIVDARAKAGDEKYLAFLCNARTLFCKVYDFLEPEDDLEKVKKRIDEVKKQIANGKNPFGDEKKYSVISNRYLRSTRRMRGGSKLTTKKSGEIEESPEVVIDDLLMLADWKLKYKDYESAGTNYYLASLIATGKFASLEYDGTTAQNAAIIGMIQSKYKDQRPKNKFVLDESYRSAELTLKLYLSTTNDEQRAEYDTDAAMKILPKYDNIVIRTLTYKLKKAINDLNLQQIENLYSKINKYGHKEVYNSAFLYTRYLISINKTAKAFSTLLTATINEPDYGIRKMNMSILNQSWAWASKKDIFVFSRKQLVNQIFLVIIGQSWDFGANRDWMQKWGARELQSRKLFNGKKYNQVLSILNNRFNQPGHEFRKAICYAEIGKTNDAFNAMFNAYKKRCKMAEQEELLYPNPEIDYLQRFAKNTNSNNISELIDFLNKHKDNLMKCKRKEESDLLSTIIENIKTFKNNKTK
ncbi:MAG: hypothetical protein DRI44_08655, partial [Chlamydiae bacterium]